MLIDIEDLSFIDGDRTLADAWAMRNDLKQNNLSSFGEQFSNSSWRKASSSSDGIYIPFLNKETKELEILKTDFDGDRKSVV